MADIKIKRNKNGDLSTPHGLDIFIDGNDLTKLISGIYSISLHLEADDVNRVAIEFYAGGVEVDAEAYAEIKAIVDKEG